MVLRSPVRKSEGHLQNGYTILPAPAFILKVVKRMKGKFLKFTKKYMSII